MSIRYTSCCTSHSEPRVSGQPKDDLESIRKVLREAGLRSTPARIAAYRFLQKSDSPASHAEVSEELTQSGFDKATVFRNLNDFAEVGLARRTELGDHVWRFELASDEHSEDAHPHFVCIDCGSVSCVDKSELTRFAGRKSIASIGRVTEILLRGHCNSCGN